MLLCKIISDGSFGELWLFELILESVVRFSSRLNVQSVSHAQCPAKQGLWETLCRLMPLSPQRWYGIALHCSFCPVSISCHSKTPPRRERVHSSWSGVRANFSCDILDKQYLEWVENHHFTYCSIYHNCKTITKTLDHDPCSSMFITHIAMGQILSSARFLIFHFSIVLFLGGRPELL